MKKIAKLLLASSMLAALVLACNNGSGLVAHDELDAPDVEAYATASGIIVLEWDAVKDATSYEVTVKKPGQEYFTTPANGYVVVGIKNGINRFVYPYDQADVEYEFRVVANSSASLMLTGVTEVSVTTPDEEDIADGLAEIALNVTLEKVKGEANRYKVSYPVDLGYSYSGYVVESSEKPAVDAETMYAKAAKSGSYDWFSSQGYNAFTTIENADGDDILVNNNECVFDKVGKYFVVLCAEPYTYESGAKKLYALSSEVSVTTDDVDDVSKPSWAENDDGAVVIHLDLQERNAIGSTYDIPAPAASTYTVWQKETETVTVRSTNSTYRTETVTVKWTSVPVKQAETTKNYAEYFATLPEKKNTTSKIVGTQTTDTYYGYNYYVTYSNKKGEKVWFAVDNLEPWTSLYKNRRIYDILKANYKDFSADFQKWIDAHEYCFDEYVDESGKKKAVHDTWEFFYELEYTYSYDMKASVWQQIRDIFYRY